MRLLLYLLVLQCTVIKKTRGDREFVDGTGEKIKDINSFCKTKPCIVKYCTEPNTLLVIYKLKPQADMKCQTLEELRNHTKRPFDIPAVDKVYKWEHITYLELTNKSLLTNFQHITFVNKSEHYQKASLDGKKFAVLEDGSLSIKQPHELPRFQIKKPGHFMVDFVINVKLNENKSRMLFSAVKLRYVLFSEEDDASNADTVFIAIGMLVSSFFLGIVLTIYCLLRSLRAWPGPVIMAYTASFKVTFIWKAALNLALNSGRVTSSECQILIPIQYYLILTTFFWLNVMTFDIFWRFRGSFKALTSDRSKIKRKFCIYCLYGFGGPLVITVAITILDIQIEDENILKPLFTHCMRGGINFLIFLYTPMATLMMVNCIFFVMTTYNLWRVNKANKEVTRRPESKKYCNQKSRFLVLKLAMVTGFYWIFDIIEPLQSNKVVSLILNIYIAFTGVIIFVLFICRKTVLKPLCEKLSIFPRYTGSFRNKNTSKSVSRSMLSKRSTYTFNSIPMLPIN